MVAGAGHVQVHLLGTLRVRRGPDEIDLGPPQRRALLAALALAEGKPLCRDELVDLLWPDRPPATAENVIQTQIKNLRQVLEPDRRRRTPSAVLPTVGSGYALRINPDAIDALRFRRLVAQARTAHRCGDLTTLAGHASAALAMWQHPVADVPALRDHPQVAALVAEWRLIASWTAETAIAEGRAEDVVALLEEQARVHPLDEQIQLLLLRSYRALGRGAEALAAYDRFRKRLVEDLGADPGGELTELYDDLLQRSGSVAARAIAYGHEAAGQAGARGGHADPQPDRDSWWGRRRDACGHEVWRGPAQLPAEIGGFVGRDAELAELTEHSSAGRAGAIAIVGPAGVGKTSLALCWAHRVIADFPDGQLFADLHGADGSPVQPNVVLERFLRALDVPAGRIGGDVDSMAAEFRSQLADRRVLVFLDNAGSPAQIRPLLAGVGPSVTVITSRQRLDGLLLASRVRRITLGPLSPAEAACLLRPAAGQEAAPADLNRLAHLCDRLPLALRIAASRLDPAHGRGPAELASEMLNERTRLDQLAVDAGEVSVRAVLYTWMRSLDPPSRRLLHLVASHPGPSPSLPTCAVMAELSEVDTAGLAENLVRAHLVMRDDRGQYLMHDLVKLVAAEQARERSPGIAEALARLYVYYRDCANIADRMLRPNQRPNFASETEPVSFRNEREALAWLDEQAPNLVAAVYAAAVTHPQLAWQIAAAMFGWLFRRHSRHQWIELYERAADAAVRCGDRNGEAMVVGRLAAAYSSLGQTAAAIAVSERAYRLRSAMADGIGAATALLNKGAAQVDARQPEAAIVSLQLAGRIVEGLPNTEHLTTLRHCNLALAHRLAGRPQLAMQHSLLAQRGSQGRELAEILVTRANIFLDLHEPAEAGGLARRALEVATEQGDVALQAAAHDVLGAVGAALGDPAAARGHYRWALAAYERLGHADAGRLHESLSALDAVYGSVKVRPAESGPDHRGRG